MVPIVDSEFCINPAYAHILSGRSIDMGSAVTVISVAHSPNRCIQVSGSWCLSGNEWGLTHLHFTAYLLSSHLHAGLALRRSREAMASSSVWPKPDVRSRPWLRGVEP